MSDITIKDNYKKHSINIVPIPKGSGKALNITGGWKKYQSEMYTKNIPDDQDFAVILGKISGNLMVLDFDECDDLKELELVMKNVLNHTLVVRTGDGYHVYFTIKELPSQANIFLNKGKYKMEVKGEGAYVIGASSKHYDKDESGKYVLTGKTYTVISNTMQIKSLNATGEEIIAKLLDLGWKVNGGNGEKMTMEKRVKCVECDMTYDLDDLDIHGMECACQEYETVEPPNTPAPIIQLSKSKNIIDRTAEQIKEHHQFVTVRNNDETLLWNGKIYSKSDAENIIKEETEKIIENCTTHERNEVVNKIKAQTGVSIEKFDEDNSKITLENGILDFDVMQIIPHTPDNLSTILIPVEYHQPLHQINDDTIFDDIEKNLKETLFWKYLTSSFTINEEFKKREFETTLEIISAFFIKHQIDEKAFMFLGRGENGKSVLLEYIESLISRKNVEHIQLQQISEDRFICANLNGKLANIFADLESDELKNTGKIKVLTSNEGMTVQEKYGKPFSMKPICKMVFSCNRFPKVYDQSQGFFRRWIIVKWERNFANDKTRDEKLKLKLVTNQDEKNLVFSTLIHLTKYLWKKGKFTHTKGWEMVRDEWNANADPLGDYVDKYIENIDDMEKKDKKNPTYREVHQHYTKIMHLKQEKPLGIAQFNKLFGEYFTNGKSSGNRVWQDISLKPIPIFKESDSE